jgi:hypothetical protein
MLINLDLYAGPGSNGNPNECRVLLDALNDHAETMRATGDKERAAQVFELLFRLAAGIAEGFLRETRTLNADRLTDPQGRLYDLYTTDAALRRPAPSAAYVPQPGATRPAPFNLPHDCPL